MTDRVSLSVRKFAAIGLLLAAVLAFVTLLIVPVSSRLSYVEQQITAKREMAGRVALLAHASDEARSAGSRSETLLSGAVYLQGKSEAVQLANLQSQFFGIADQEGVRLQWSRTLSMTEREGLQVVGLHATMQLDVGTLQRLLHRIEQHRPLMIVDVLAITPVRDVGSSGAADGDALQVELRILTLVPPAKGDQP